MPKKRSRGKYTGEIEKIRMLKSLNSMMKTSDMENALLSNSARDSETVSDGVVDDMLSKISVERDKGIQAVEKITAYSMSHGRAPQKAARASPTRRKSRPARKQSAGKRKSSVKRKAARGKRAKRGRH